MPRPRRGGPQKNMKKTLIFSAVLAAMTAGQAVAATNVTLYGIVDTGLVFTRVNKADGQGSVNNLFEGSGISRGSRWGLKGEEELGDGLKVGFVLEAGMDTDSGKFTAAAGADKQFGRESQIYISGNYGLLGMGRLQHLTAGFGSWGIASRIISPFAHGWGAGYIGGYKTVFGFNSGRIDNGIAYKSPTFGGFNAYAAYSTKTSENAAGVENKASADRYAALAATWKGANLTAFGSVEMIDWSNENAATADADDALAITLGGNYKFGFGQVYLAGQYFDNVNGLPTPFEIVKLKKGGDAMIKGWGVQVGTSFRALSGLWRGTIGYRDAELVNDSDYTAKRISVSASYQYPFSKRTYIFVGANYTRDKIKMPDTIKPHALTVTSGLSMSF